jgi:hypothetical protein
VRHAQQHAEDRADEPGFLVRVDRVVASRAGTANRGERQQHVERYLRERRPDLHTTDERRAKAAEHPKSRDRDVLAEGVRDEIHLVPEGGERADAMEFAERRAARLEEWLGRNHQNPHGLCDLRMKL